jgi:PAS domain S-box-containing protein
MSIIAPIDKEYVHEGSVIISQTDEKGIITYANKRFCEVSGYTANELVGHPHNIIRHPSMPKAVFAKMWQTISSGQAWNGLVKNLRKDGLYYWVETEILPIKDDNGKITGYMAVRKHASRTNVLEMQDIYNRMLEEA